MALTLPHGVMVTSDMATLKAGCLYFEVLEATESDDADSPQEAFLLVVHNANDYSMYIDQCTLVPETPVLTIEDERNNPVQLLKVPSGEESVLWLRSGFPHVFSGKLLLHFNSNEGWGALKISCPIEVSCKSVVALQMASADKGTTKKPLNIKIILKEEPCKRTVRVMALKSVKPLKEYRLPARFKETIKALHDGSSPEIQTLLGAELSMKQYAKRFSLLLHLEEYQQTNDMRKCYMHTRLPRSGEQLVLKVDSIRQKDLSCLPGDQVLIRPQTEEVFYQAHVHSVNGDEVTLTFGKRLKKLYREDLLFTVAFTLRRLTLRIKHRAVCQAERNGLNKVLFPSEAAHGAPPAKPRELSLFDQTLNEEQRKAVKHIVAGISRPAPYLVFGPPGTGKTVTLVEAIKQVERCRESCHILACASTNCAADLLCAKIRGPGVYRLYALSQEGRVREEQPEEPLNCNWGQDGIFMPSKEELMKYKIMVTTLYTSSRLVTGGLPPGFYTHIFVDEAGQPCEPEVVIPLAGLLDPRVGQVILAGDPKQLGPIVVSRLAKRHGLGVSLLERLMELKMYQKDTETGYNERFITKLLRNYSHMAGESPEGIEEQGLNTLLLRSHGNILEIPNELFYEKELLVSADPDVRNSLSQWEHLPTKGFPLVFHEVTGRMLREESTSLFNPLEVAILMSYLKELLESQVPPADIGLMAPYRKQVERIQKAIGLKFPQHAAEIKVGTVEEFQGGQKRVILLSTVRTDRSPHLGFVDDPKKFNVAMTRAQALLIVAGNSKALTTNATWGRFVQYCREHGGYIDSMLPLIEKLHI